MSPVPFRRRGFALLVTIVLVAFLVLILVALATFTRVETQVAENSQNLAKARQNALFALNVALGELQRATGPDQRVTVTADIGTVGDGDASTPDNGLPFASDGALSWTGVLGNGANPINPLDARKAAHTGETPVLLNWLVSGNEGVTFTASTAANNFGQITAAPPANGAGAIRFAPNATVGGLDASTTTASAITITATDGATVRDATLLVGPGSAANDVDPAAPQLNYVVAPMVNLEVPENQVPGRDPASTAPVTIGRYAWWVGDEGVKARVNLDDPNKGITSGDAARLRTLVAARSGIELLTGFDQVNPDASSTTLARMLSDKQAAFLDGVTVGKAKARFHDITPYSLGVLANTATGGLKKDLTAGLLDAYNASEHAEIADDEALFTLPATAATSGAANESAAIPFASLTAANLGALRTPAWSGEAPARLPNWGMLRSHARFQRDLDTDVPLVDPVAPSNSSPGIHPLVTRFQLFVYAVPAFSGSTLPGPELRAIYLPAVVLWNPYNVRLAPQKYAFYYEHNYTTFSGNANPARPPSWPNEAPYVQGGEYRWPVFFAVHGPAATPETPIAVWQGVGVTAAQVAAYRPLMQGSGGASQYFGERGFRMVINCNRAMEPGEAIIFTPEATRELSNTPSGNELVPGWRVAGFFERISASIPADRHIHYVHVIWPPEVRDYQRFSLGLGDSFTTGPGGFADQAPANLLQVVSGVRSGNNDDFNPHVIDVDGRLFNTATPFDYSEENRIPGVRLPRDNGTGSEFGITYKVGNHGSNSDVFQIASWDPTWVGGEIDVIWPGATGLVLPKPSHKIAYYTFRMDFPFRNTDLSPYASAWPRADFSTRWLAGQDPTSPRLGRSAVEGLQGGINGNPLYAPSSIMPYHGTNYTTGDPLAFFIPSYDADLERTYVGGAHGRVQNPNGAGAVDSPRTMAIKHLPRGLTGEGHGLLSIGALQHASLHPTQGLLQIPASTTDNPSRGYASNMMPTYAIGNSLADPLVNPADVDGFPNAWNTINFATMRSEAKWLRLHFDLSLVANRALWDRYFFSGVKRGSDTAVDSANSRILRYDPDARFAKAIADSDGSGLQALRNFNRAASHHMVAGAFNVNSISREAWRAVLSGLRNAPVPDANVPGDTTPFPRVNVPASDALQTSGTNNQVPEANKFRSLTDAQISALAGEIADEVRRRGPVLSLAAFVNRKPTAGGDAQAGYTTGPDDAPGAVTSAANRASRLQGFQRYLGPLQLAIDRVTDFNTTTGQITDMATGINRNMHIQSRLDSSVDGNNGGFRRHAHISRLAYGGHREITGNATTNADFERIHVVGDAPLALRSRAYGSPGYLTQADILQVIGGHLSARSDTFRVRTYGEVTNPVTGQVVGRAWLEAVVQRTPEFVNPAVDADGDGVADTAVGDLPHEWRPAGSAAAANSWNPSNTHDAANLRFGRKYRIVQFRWLDASDV
jgi:hypothetical protein